MGASYRLRIIKQGAPAIESAAKVDQKALKLARANGEILYSFPLQRVVGLSHPAPNVLRAKIVLPDGNFGSLELQEAAVGNGFAPLTALYSELVKELEGLRGQPRHRANSMEPIVMSNFLKQAAASFGAPADPSAFLVMESTPASPAAPAAPQKPVMIPNAAFEQSPVKPAPSMFDDDDEEEEPKGSAITALPSKDTKDGDEP